MKWVNAESVLSSRNRVDSCHDSPYMCRCCCRCQRYYINESIFSKCCKCDRKCSWERGRWNERVTEWERKGCHRKRWMDGWMDERRRRFICERACVCVWIIIIIVKGRSNEQNMGICIPERMAYYTGLKREPRNVRSIFISFRFLCYADF